MLASRLHIHLARIVIELPQGAALGSGDFHDTEDMPFVVDANGLPTLPGAGIAGALCSVLQTLEVFKTCELAALFGTPSGSDLKLSELAIDFGYLHNQDDLPVSGLSKLSAISGDPVLALCKKGITRQHAPHNHEGVALEGGLHNRQHIPAGARFTLELRLESSHPKSGVLEKIVQTMQHPLFRLGGGKNDGIGAVKVIRFFEKCFHLKDLNDLNAWMDWPKSLAQIPPCGPSKIPSIENIAIHQLTLTLPMQSYWCIGGGANETDLKDVNSSQQSIKNHPLVEHAISWSNHREQRPHVAYHPLVEQAISWSNTSDKNRNLGSVVKNVVVPGSSIKGVLAHQMAFEVRAASSNGQLAEPDARPVELIKLLGSASAQAKTSETANAKDVATGAAGHFWLQDLLIPIGNIKACYTTYNVIDQLSKGTVDGGLFTEKVCLPHELNITGYCTAPMDETAIEIQALKTSLVMLCDGRLAIGNHSAAGHGFADGGKAVWSPVITIKTASVSAEPA